MYLIDGKENIMYYYVRVILLDIARPVSSTKNQSETKLQGYYAINNSKSPNYNKPAACRPSRNLLSVSLAASLRRARAAPASSSSA